MSYHYREFLSLDIFSYDFFELNSSNHLELFNLLRKTINTKGFVVLNYGVFYIYLVNKYKSGMSVKVIHFYNGQRECYYKFLDYIKINCERTEILNCFGTYLKDYYIPRVIYV